MLASTLEPRAVVCPIRIQYSIMRQLSLARKSTLISKPSLLFNYSKRTAGSQRPGFYGCSCSQMKASLTSSVLLMLSHSSPAPFLLLYISMLLLYTSTSHIPPPAIHFWLTTLSLDHYSLSSSVLLSLNTLSFVLISRSLTIQ